MAWVAAGCGEASDGGDGVMDAGPGDAGVPPPDNQGYKTCDLAERVGGIEVILERQFTSVQGSFADGVLPTRVPAVHQTEGPCQLRRPKELFCDPACPSGMTCGDGATCVALPVNQDLGAVRVTGLSGPVEIAARAPVFFYNFLGDLPHPGCRAGDELVLSAGGTGATPFSVQAEGVDALQVTTASMALQRGQPGILDWSAGGARPGVKVVIDVNIANHGGTPGNVWCEVDDTGHFEIPAALLDGLLDLGFSGFPSATLTRQGVGAVDTDLGCVELRARSTVSIPVDIPGLVSCSGDEDCPMGQVCQVDLTCG